MIPMNLELTHRSSRCVRVPNMIMRTGSQNHITNKHRVFYEMKYVYFLLESCLETSDGIDIAAQHVMNKQPIISEALQSLMEVPTAPQASLTFHHSAAPFV